MNLSKSDNREENDVIHLRPEPGAENSIVVTANFQLFFDQLGGKMMSVI